MRHNTMALKKLFLDTFQSMGNVRKAVDVVNESVETGDSRGSLDRSTVYHWRKKDLQFARDFDTAAEAFADSLETMALSRLQHPEGNRGGDVLLMFMLNALRPEKYRPSNSASAGADAREALSAMRLRLQQGSDGSTTVDIESGSRTNDG